MNNLTQNLILAEYAVKYVESIMSKGPGAYNRPESVVHRVLPQMPGVPPLLQGPDPRPAQSVMEKLGEAMFTSPWKQAKQEHLDARKAWADKLNVDTANKAAEIRADRERQQKELMAMMKGAESSAATAILVGSEVELFGLGNCGEQSYVAFKYLVTKGAPGLAIVDWDEMVGAPKAATRNTGNHTFVVIGMPATVPKVTEASITRPPHWGPDAVVCDPWYHEWFAVTHDWERKMKRILGETKGVKVSDHYLNRGVADRDPAKSREYQQGVDALWQFKRLAYLVHASPLVKHLACNTGNSLKTLHAMRAGSYRGAVL